MTASDSGAGVTIRCAAWAAVAVTVLLAWQALIVYGSYGGDWTALFMTGGSGRHPIPPELLSNTYVFKDSNGFDGQFYRYVAHDPFLRRGLNTFMDAPSGRYHRILVPLLAWLLAGGRTEWIDAAYQVVILGSVFLGTWWLARFAAARGHHPAWGSAFAVLPATLISANRMTVDVALTALCAGFVWYAHRDSPRWLYAIAVLAPLARETGILLTAAACLYAVLNRRWLRSVVFATASAPFFFWHRFVAGHLEAPGAFAPQVNLDIVPWLGFIQPFRGIVEEFGQLPDYPLPPLAKHFSQSLDVAALSSIVVASAFAFWQARRARSQPESVLAALFAILAVGLSYRDFWVDINGYSRTMTPLVLLVAMRAASGESLWTLAPWAVMDLRLSLQFGSQILTALADLFSRPPHG
jgi:hypothetical protein